MKLQQLIFLMILIVSNVSYSQIVDTIWYNNPNNTRDNHSFYYKLVKKDTIKDRYSVIYFYTTGEISNTYELSSMDPEIRDGYFYRYDKEGNITYKSRYKDDIMIEATSYNKKGKEVETIIRKRDSTGYKDVYHKIDKSPMFPGGDSQLLNYLAKTTKYPSEMREKGIEGQVIVEFVISKKGEIIDSRISKSVHPLIDEEALRVVNNMPTWTPGKLNGKKVAVQYELPFNFRLNKN